MTADLLGTAAQRPVPRLRNYAVLARQCCPGRGAGRCCRTARLDRHVASGYAGAAPTATGAAGAAALLGAALALREGDLSHLCEPRAGDAVPARDLAALIARWRTRRSATAWRSPAKDGRGGSVPGRPEAAALLAPVLWSAGDLLAGAARRFVRRCANDRCLWLFLDQKQGGTRRWCDMTSCGNRAKARRHYLRTKRG